MRIASFCLCLFAAVASSAQELILVNVADISGRALGVRDMARDDGTVAIIGQEGEIGLLRSDGTLAAQPLLDIGNRIARTNQGGIIGEGGLLGVAFHPNYGGTGPGSDKLYVSYTANSQDIGYHNVISRFTMTADPDVADSTSEEIIIRVDQPATNHNGGDIYFGNDGYLYIAVGDGGGSGDDAGLGNNAQNLDNLLGTILRLDVDSAPTPGAAGYCGDTQNYTVPANNPLVGTAGCDEILHFGLRNPYRFHVDPQTGDLWIGDVGQFDWEEVDFAAAAASGINYGWSCREGLNDFNGPCDNNPGPGPLVDPVFDYSSADGSGNCSITGGIFDRSADPLRSGTYFYADLCSREVWQASFGTRGLLPSLQMIGQTPAATVGFGHISDGRTFVTDSAGTIQQIDTQLFADSFN